MHEARVRAADGTLLRYRVAGSGPPLLLHMGAAGDGSTWEAAGYLAALGERRCVLLDPRGHGASGRPPDVEAHRIERYVEDVLAVLDDLGAPRAAFWGYSDGARVGLALAAAHPGRVTALVAQGALDPQGPRPCADVREVAAAVRSGGCAALVSALEAAEGILLPERLRASLAATDAEMLALELEAWLDWPGPWPLLPRIACPALLLAGELEDPDADLPRAAALLPRGEARRLPGRGHLGAFLAVERVLAEVLPFLARAAPD